MGIGAEVRALVATAEQMNRIEQVEEWGDMIGTDLWTVVDAAFPASFKLLKRVQDGVASAKAARLAIRRRDRLDLLMRAEATDLDQHMLNAGVWCDVVSTRLERLIRQKHPKKRRLELLVDLAGELRASSRSSHLTVGALLDGLDAIEVDADDLEVPVEVMLAGQAIVDQIPAEASQRNQAEYNRIARTREVHGHLAAVDQLIVDVGDELDLIYKLKPDDGPVPGMAMGTLRASRGRAGGPRPTPSAPTPELTPPPPAAAPIGSGLPPLEPDGE